MTRIRFEDLPSTNTPRNAENLNKLNNVAISSTEPNTGEEVWIDTTNKKIKTISGNSYSDFYEEGYAPNGFYSESNNINNPTNSGKLLIKKAYVTEDNTPNNGVVLQYGEHNDWNGQLFIGDNAEQGVWYNGWSSGVRGTWKKLAFENSLQTGSGTINNNYISQTENNHWEKIGNVVSYAFTLETTGTWGVYTVFISNLPKPINTIRFSGLNYNMNTIERFEINSNGEIALTYSGTIPTSGQTIEGHITYLTND